MSDKWLSDIYQLQTEAHAFTDLALDSICPVISKAPFDSPPGHVMGLPYFYKCKVVFIPEARHLLGWTI